jgi:8-oxo-dGTP pyrophosphatase MutT (NUDIX family)
MAQDILTMASHLFSLTQNDFNVSTGLLITYHRNHIFAVHNPDRWLINGSHRKAGVVGIGGKLEKGETVLQCVKRECKEEINTDVRITDSENTFIVTGESISRLPLITTERPRPYYIILLNDAAPRKTVVFSYRGDIIGTPTPGDVSALLLAPDTVLQHLQSPPKTVKFMKEHAAHFIERISLPDDLQLIFLGTLSTYLRVIQ